jgi:hypothetical protein
MWLQGSRYRPEYESENGLMVVSMFGDYHPNPDAVRPFQKAPAVPMGLDIHEYELVLMERDDYGDPNSAASVLDGEPVPMPGIYSSVAGRSSVAKYTLAGVSLTSMQLGPHGGVANPNVSVAIEGILHIVAPSTGVRISRGSRIMFVLPADDSRDEMSIFVERQFESDKQIGRLRPLIHPVEDNDVSADEIRGNMPIYMNEGLAAVGRVQQLATQLGLAWPAGGLGSVAVLDRFMVALRTSADKRLRSPLPLSKLTQKPNALQKHMQGTVREYIVCGVAAIHGTTGMSIAEAMVQTSTLVSTVLTTANLRYRHQIIGTALADYVEGRPLDIHLGKK